MTDFAAGGLDLKGAGFVWILFGILLASWPQEGADAPRTL
jgi:hypothetical protein